MTASNQTSRIMRIEQSRLTFGLLVALAVLASACGGANGTSQVGLLPTAVVVAMPANGAPSPEVVEVHTLQAGERAVDIDGTTVALHSWVRWPEIEATTALFGRLRVEPDHETLVAVRVEVCAAVGQAPGQELFRGRFQTVDPVTDLTTNLHDSASSVLDPLVEPGFVWPAAGECAEGWQVLRWSGSGDPVFQYTAVAVDDEKFGQQTVNVWSELPELSKADATDASAVPSPGAVEVGASQSVAQGALAGWKMTVHGWLEVPDMRGQRGPFGTAFAVAREDHHLVAVSVEVCAGDTLALPGFGLQIDGWNLIGQFRSGSVWAPALAEVDLPDVGDCSSGWIAFESPDGTAPTGVFLADPNDSTSPWLQWPLGDDQLDLPELEGFPTNGDLTSAEAACSGFGGTDPIGTLQVFADSDVGKTWPVGEEIDIASAVAIHLTESLTEIHLSSAMLTALDIPVPRSSDTFSIVVRLSRDEPGDLTVGEYGPAAPGAGDSRTVGAAQVRIVRGDGGGYLPLPAVTVVVDSVQDSAICGHLTSVLAGDDQDLVVGSFASPRWSVPS